MLSRVAIAAVAISVLTACGVGKPKQANEVDTSPIDTDPVPSSDHAPVASDDGDDAPAPTPKPKNEPASDDYEITHRDCRALGAAYGNAWLNDEMVKLGKQKLKPADHTRFAEQLQGDAHGMADQYQGECDKTVGTAYLRERLACAVKSKSMSEFNACLDGQAR
jgi:hypothetical protein